jgi:hypothetical protein
VAHLNLPVLTLAYRAKDRQGRTKDNKDSRDSQEGRPCAIPSSRNLLAPERVQAAEEFFQAGEG